MGEAFLVCEGQPDSRDTAVLKTMVDRFGLFVTVHAAGGDRGLRNIRAYLMATRRGSAGITIEDRNYRPMQEALESWDTGKPRLVWSRHEIENYLLHPRVLSRAFERIQNAAAKARWVRDLPRDEASVETRLLSAAVPLLDDHAAKRLCHELNALTTLDNPADFRTPAPPAPSGARIAGRTEWLPALQQEAARVRSSSHRVGSLDDLHPERIAERYEALLAEVHDPAFLGERRFLSDMEGKELLKAFVAELQSKDVPKLRWNADLDAEVIAALADEYQPGLLFAPDDFDRLRERLEILQAQASLL